MRGKWSIAFPLLFIMIACGPRTETGTVTDFGQSVSASGGVVQSFVLVRLDDGTEVRAWLPEDDQLWRNLDDGAKSRKLRIKIQKEGEAWRFAEILPARKLEKGEVSVALLPFLDISPNRDQEDYCNRITEEVLNALSQEEALRVTGKASTMTFREQERVASEIGRQLGVSYVIDGIVRPSGDRPDIALEVLRVADNVIVWSGVFGVNLQDVASVRAGSATIIKALLADARQVY